MARESGPRTVQAVQITLDIVDALQDRDGAGVTELAEGLGYSKATVHSHLATLLKNDFIVKRDGKYRLGLRFIELGRDVEDRIRGFDVITTELDDLAAESNELAQFGTYEHGKVVYLYKASGENAVQTASDVGTREYMHCISLGKAMLSQLPEAQVDEIVDRYGLPSMTENTITTRSKLKAELEEIRERGYAYDEEEKIEGLRCVAAPVELDGDLLGAVSVSGPSSRMQGAPYREQLPDMVTRSVNVIEINAKYS